MTFSFVASILFQCSDMKNMCHKIRDGNNTVCAGTYRFQVDSTDHIRGLIDIRAELYWTIPLLAVFKLCFRTR